MNLVARQNSPARWKRGILYGMLLLAVMVSLPLGMAGAAMGAWYAIKGGSLMYLPLGLVILLAGLTVARSHAIEDFIVLLLVALGMIAWSIAGSDARSQILNSMAELSGHVGLLPGLLAITVVALFVVHWKRSSARQASRSRLVWVGIPLLLLTMAGASVGLAATFVR